MSAIDLSKLPPPDAIEPVAYEDLLARWQAEVRRRWPEFDTVSEADPVHIVIETGAYLHMLEIVKRNDAVRAVMLASAVDADLAQLAALFQLERKVVDPGDPDARPPVLPTYESDESLLRRAQLFPSSVSTAGPESSWRYHAINASPLVKDAGVASPNPGEITITVLSAEGNGTAGQALLDTVETALSDKRVRPMGDVLTVESAAIVEYQVTAQLTIGSGPDAATVLAAAEASVRAAAEARHALGAGMPLSALYAALHVEGVAAVALSAPAADVAATEIQAAYATQIEVTAA